LTDSSGRFDALLRALQHSSRTRAAVAAIALALLAGCGKKGPPLAPYSALPAAPLEFSVRRRGDQVEIRFKVPATNSDGRHPAKIDRVQVYGLTMPGDKPRTQDKQDAEGNPGHHGKGNGGHPQSSGVSSGGGYSVMPGPPGAPGVPGAGGHERELPIRKHGTVVSSLLVRKPPPPPKEPKDDEPPPPPPPPRTDPGLDQGDPVLVMDTLTAASLTPVEIPESESGSSRDRDRGGREGSDRDRSRTRQSLRPFVMPPDLGPPLPRPPLRYYAVSGMNGGKKGPLTQPIPVPVEDVPPTPPTPIVTVAEGKINVAITAPEGLRQPVLPLTPSPIAASAPTLASAAAPGASAPPSAASPVAGTPVPHEADDVATQVPCTPAPQAAPVAGAPAAAAVPDAPVAPGAPVAPPAPGAPTAAPAPSAPVAPPCIPAPTTLLQARLLSTFPTPTYGFLVYEMAPPDFKPPVQQPGAVPPYPVLLTPAAVNAGIWSDNRFVVGANRCYSVTTVMTQGLMTVESAPTGTVCVKTVDTFPPAAPRNLQAVASEGTISLIWDANTEPDLAGYIVLRGAAGSDKLTAITPTPIKETTFRDTAVKAGVRYAYVVIAVDTATPQNISAQSNRVEETAR
jgi:predicted small lipoprotein YifL